LSILARQKRINNKNFGDSNFPSTKQRLVEQTMQWPKKGQKNDLQNITQKTKNLATRTSLKTGNEERVGL
jgi:hypothetical protein